MRVLLIALITRGRSWGRMRPGSDTNAFFWDPANQTLQPITNTLGGIQAWANKINDQGQVVGYAEATVHPDPIYVHAFLWPVNQDMLDWGPWGEPKVGAMTSIPRARLWARPWPILMMDTEWGLFQGSDRRSAAAPREPGRRVERGIGPQ